MEVTVKNNDKIVKIAKFLEDHKCTDTVVLDVREMCGWTNYFVITTVRSQAHMNGLVDNLYQFLHELSIFALNGKRGRNEKGWVLMDCGDVVVHLMEKEQRDYYELERLWFKSTMIYLSSKSS
jgi:ribosome-associated protein